MSKVKFIQWGTPKKPKTIEQYNDDFVSVVQSRYYQPEENS